MSPSDPPEELEAKARERLTREGQPTDDHSVARIELELQHEELQRAHDELARTHRRYRQLFECAPVAFVSLDPSFVVEQMNGAALELLGDRRGRPVTDLAARANASTLLALVSLTTTTGNAAEELALEASDGRPIVARISTQRFEQTTLLAIEDVTAAREARERLERSERQLRHLIQSAPDGIAVLRRSNLVEVNDAFARLLVSSPAELRGRTLSSFTDAVLDSIERATGESFEVRLRATDGSERMTECRALRVEYGDRPAHLLFVRDLTERRRMEARVDQAERLAAVGMLVAGVAHEINNPLAYVLANLETLERTAVERGDGELTELVEEALEGSRRIGGIIRDLRSFQRTDERLERVDLNEVVAESCKMARAKVQGSAVLRIDPGQLPPTLGNHGRLCQVVLNLVLNAALAMPEDRPRDENLVRVRTWATEQDLCIAVEDNGRGIEDDDVPLLFDPFWSKRKGSGGTGLGLSISNSIVQQLGGFIEVESELGRGSRFIVHLPRRDPTLADQVDRDRPKTEPAPPRASPARLLIVDDEPTVARALARALRTLGEVDIVGSGNAAIAHLSADPEYDAVISDLVMPDGTGIDLARWVEGNAPRLLERLVFMTGMPHPDLASYDDRPHLEKPFDIPRVRNRLLHVMLRADQLETEG